MKRKYIYINLCFCVFILLCFLIYHKTTRSSHSVQKNTACSPDTSNSNIDSSRNQSGFFSDGYPHDIKFVHNGCRTSEVEETPNSRGNFGFMTPPVNMPPVHCGPVNMPPVHCGPVNMPPVHCGPVNMPPVNCGPVNMPPVNCGQFVFMSNKPNITPANYGQIVCMPPPVHTHNKIIEDNKCPKPMNKLCGI
jgi:hypothetical protein